MTHPQYSLDCARVIHALRQSIEYIQAGDGTNATICARDAAALLSIFHRFPLHLGAIEVCANALHFAKPDGTCGVKDGAS